MKRHHYGATYSILIATCYFQASHLITPIFVSDRSLLITIAVHKKERLALGVMWADHKLSHFGLSRLNTLIDDDINAVWFSLQKLGHKFVVT